MVCGRNSNCVSQAKKSQYMCILTYIAGHWCCYYTEVKIKIICPLASFQTKLKASDYVGSLFKHFIHQMAGKKNL